MPLAMAILSGAFAKEERARALGIFSGITGCQAALDIPGLVFVAVAALALVWGLLRGNLAGWASAEIISPLAAGTLFAAAFVAWELRASAPMVPMRLFQSRAFSSGMNAG
jgi:hypothetical protein